MQCPKCSSDNVNIAAVTEIKSKTRWGCGCLVTWLAFLFPKHTSKTHTEAVCQQCGNRWVVSRSVVNKNARTHRADAPQETNASVGVFDNLHSEELPFYKRTWFLIVCGLLFPPAGIALVWLVYKDWDIKKKGIVSGIMALWFIIAILAGGGDEPSGVVSESDTPAIYASTSDLSPSDSTNTKLAFTIKGGELGKYGKWLTLGEDSEFPDRFIAYHLPVGEYRATNLDVKYPLCIYVYSDDTEIVDGWECQVDCRQTVNMGAGESGVFSMPDGYYIQLAGADDSTEVLIEQQ